jgi:hypothetical protein
MRRPTLLLATLVLAAGWSRGASPDPADLAVPADVQAKARGLVKQLGSGNFDEREAAQRQLADLGRLARSALLEGASTSPSPEVRLRAAELLPVANALDLQARIDTFLADARGEYEHDLPGWKAFRAAARNDFTLFGYTLTGTRELDRPARAVFATLLTDPDNRRLLVAAGQRDPDFPQLVAERRVEVYNRKYGRIPGIKRRNPTLEEMTALLFAESLAPTAPTLRTVSMSSLISSSGFTTAGRDDDEKARVYRAIARDWLATRREARDMYYGMTIALNLNMTEELCWVATRLLATPGASASYRGRAATNLVTHGDARHVAQLEKARGDALVVYTVRITVRKDGKSETQTYALQVRDIALAASLLLTNQKLEDYGFADRYANNPSYKNRAYSYSRYYFPDEEARKAAFAKWEKWKKGRAGK